MTTLRRLLLAIALVAAACSGDDPDISAERANTSTTAGDGGSSTTTDGGSSTTTASPSPSSTATPGDRREATVEVLDVVPHRTDAFTQGLELADGVLWEGTGQVGRSEVAALDPDTGEVLRSTTPPGRVFGEGITLVGDRLIQLTWQDNIAFVYDRASLDVVGEFTYEGEGWGLCFDGTRLVMSDGSAELTFRDPGTFDELDSVTVTRDGEPVDQLNELECVGDRVYANVWHTDTIVAIDPADGEVTTVIDASALRAQLDPAPTNPEAVLNGIAHDPDAGTFWLTGKLWPQRFEVRFAED